MPINEKYQRITELDFERIKTNFRRFLESQDQFTDYDFSGSNIDVLLDLFAYNTHYDAFYINAGINESYLSTAQKRGNIAKAAKTLSYIPHSKIGATTLVDIRITVPLDTLINVFGGTDYGIVQLQKHNRFQTKIGSDTYTFVNTEAVSLIQLSDTEFEAKDVPLRQGIPNTFRYTYDRTETDQRFIIPTDDVDIQTLNVYSQNPSLANFTNFTLYKDVPVEDTTSTTPIYFLFENELGRYEVSFGDGRYGYQPVNNEVIYLEYLIVRGGPANGASQFTGGKKLFLSGNEITNATVTVTSTQRTSGGTTKEDDESVRYYAPKYYLTQGNAIVNSDFPVIIKQQLPNIEAVNTWGGEDNEPPKYGRTIITAKPYGSLYLTEAEKTILRKTIKQRMVTTIRPEIVDPKYIYTVFDITVKYDSEQTVKTEQNLQIEVNEKVQQYAKENFGEFKYEFVSSRLVEQIRALNPSFDAVNVDLHLKKRFIPTLNIPTSYTFYYINPIYYPYSGFIGSITSSRFKYAGYESSYLKQNSNGNLDVVAFVNEVETVIQANIGQVDYANGIVVLRAFNPQAFSGSAIEISVQPREKDIAVAREFLLQAAPSDISVSMVDKNEAADDRPEATVDVTSNAY